MSKVLKLGQSQTNSIGSTFMYSAWENHNGELRKESDYFSAGAILFEICNPMWIM